MDLVTILMVVVGILVIVVVVFGWELHKKGVATQAIPQQVGLKAADIVDTIRDTVLKELQRHKLLTASSIALQDMYFDVDDFLMDLGRLPPTFTKTVLLDGAIKRNGSGETVEYFTQANGNVTKTRPAGATK